MSLAISVPSTLFVILSIAVTVATVAWMVLNRRHPEAASSHEPDRPRARPEPPTDRPADAGAESQVAEPSARVHRASG